MQGCAVYSFRPEDFVIRHPVDLVINQQIDGQFNRAVAGAEFGIFEACCAFEAAEAVLPRIPIKQGAGEGSFGQGG